jgi:hypothetical protein
MSQTPIETSEKTPTWTLPVGTKIKINGLPYWLLQEATILGYQNPQEQHLGDYVGTDSYLNPSR